MAKEVEEEDIAFQQDIIYEHQKETFKFLEQLETEVLSSLEAITEKENVNCIEPFEIQLRHAVNLDIAQFKNLEAVIKDKKATIKNTNEILKCKKNLEDTNKKDEEEMISTKEVIKQNDLLKKAIATYSKNFDMYVEITNSTESKFDALVRFSAEKSAQPVKFSIDKSNRCLMNLDTLSSLPDETEIKLNKQLKDNSTNAVKVISLLRDSLLKNQNVK